jgi:hypothetical protein
MTEQQNRNRRQTREETAAVKLAGAEDARKRSALDDRCRAVRRWIDEDDDSCCRGID